jgi:hypothetical protein
LAESDEQMALLVQRVSGMPYRHTFFPSLAGVAFSRNMYAWTDRIDRTRGMIRLVFGLGTRAVDRTNFDYPRLVAVSHPELRPEVGTEVVKYSQRELDLLDLDQNELVTRPVEEILQNGDYPNLELFVSTLTNGFLTDPSSAYLFGRDDPAPTDLVLTFNNLIRRTDFVPLIGRMLETLEQAYDIPIDTEFTAFVTSQGKVRINLLQCRPMGIPGMEGGEVTIPEGIPKARILFRADRIVSGGLVSHVRYVIYIDPILYAEIPTIEMKRSIGRLVGKINSHPLVQEGKSIMIGPGRWGSSNINMGVNVSYADIHNTSVLVEVAREEAGHAPEVSYGTHFFQDLVEAQIIYLPVYPADPNSDFNLDFFQNSPNCLSVLVSNHVGVSLEPPFHDIVRVIDVPQVTGGLQVFIAADPHRQQALAYLAATGGA